MTVHIILLSIICILGFVIYMDGASKKKNKRFLMSSFFCIFLVESLRGKNVGLDTENYVKGFEILDKNINRGYYSWTANGWEPLWKLLNKFIGIFTDNPQWLLAVASMIILSGIAIFIYFNTDEDKSVFFPVFFFMTLAILYPMSMYLLRQFCAAVFLINIYTVCGKYEVKKAFVKSIVLTIIAAGFHYSAIIVGPLFLCLSLWKRISKKFLIINCFFAGILPLLYELIVKILLVAAPQYVHYLSRAGESMRAYTIVMTLLRVVCCGIILCYLNPEHVSNRSIYILCIYNIWAAGLMILQSKTIMAQRFGNYFEIFIILFVPQLLDKFKKSHQLYIVAFIAGWLFFIFELNTGARQTVPYTFFWE